MHSPGPACFSPGRFAAPMTIQPGNDAPRNPQIKFIEPARGQKAGPGGASPERTETAQPLIPLESKIELCLPGASVSQCFVRPNDGPGSGVSRLAAFAYGADPSASLQL